jgi:hypothetical protein
VPGKPLAATMAAVKQQQLQQLQMQQQLMQQNSRTALPNFNLSKEDMSTFTREKNLPRDRCYDFLNIFAEKFSENIGVFDSKRS